MEPESAPDLIVRSSEPAPFERKPDLVKQAMADLEELEDSRLNLELAKQIHDALSMAYPRHRWEVYVDRKAGHYNIRNLSLSGQWGMILHPRELEDVTRMAVNRGGELLERYRIARTRAGAEQAKELMVRDSQEYRKACYERAKRLLRGQGIDWNRVKPQAILVGPAQPEGGGGA